MSVIGIWHILMSAGTGIIRIKHLQCFWLNPAMILIYCGFWLHFHRERKPKKAGEAKRCINCAHEPKCVYSALKIYMRDHFDRGWRRWPLTILTNDINEDNLIKAIETGPYGRCVYECDNNVVDHQVVNLEYEGGVTAGFTMSGFNIGGREIIIQGSEMVLRGNMNTNEIILTDFLGEEVFRININPDGSDFHGGGDKALVQEWLEALQTGDQSKITTGPRESWKAIRRFLWRKNQGEIINKEEDVPMWFIR